MHKNICLGLLAASLILSLSPATAADKSSLEPTYRLWPSLTQRITDPNPAEAIHDGKGRLGFLSLRLDMGSTFPLIQTADDFKSLAERIQELGLNEQQSTDSQQFDQIERLIERSINLLKDGGRLDYEVEALIARFQGAPFPIEIANRPLTLGLSLGLEGRGFVDTQLSPAFSGGIQAMSKSLPLLLGNSGETSIGYMSSRANQLLSSATQLQGTINSLTQYGARFMQNPQSATPQDIAQINQQVTSLIDSITTMTPVARELTSGATQTAQSANGILNALEAASSGGINSEATIDMHGTLGVSAAYPIVNSQDFRLSLGTNLKLFVLPGNISLNELGLNTQGNGTLLGNIRMSRVKGLDNLGQAKQTLNHMDSAINEVNVLIDQANEMKEGLQRAQASATTDNLGELASQATTLLQQVDTTEKQLERTNSEVTQALQGVTTLQQSLLQDLRNVRFEGQMTTPGGAGFGVDIGAEAVIMRNLRVGFLLQNPLVIWQGTEKPFEVDINGKVTVYEDQAKSVNYTAGTPFTALLSGQYSFDEVLPEFPGLTLNGLFEYVANGRTPALSLNAQKQFGPAYIGLGGRLGGITSSIFLQAGLRTSGPFGLDFLLGISPTGTGIPSAGLNAISTGGLNFYLLF